MLHSNNFDFNDDILEPTSELFMALAKTETGIA